MDQTENKQLPCIVQALRAATFFSTPTPTPTPSTRLHTLALPSVNASNRCTRSQAAPEWASADTLGLVEQIAAVDTEEWSRGLSSFQKWKIVAGNLAQLGMLGRSANQCKRRWELLLSDYVKIRKWEMRHKSHNTGSGSTSYWNTDPTGREKHGLPVSFDNEVYSAIDAVIKVETEFHPARSSKDFDSELLSVGPINLLDNIADLADPSTDLKAEDNSRFNQEKIMAWELAVKLQENVDQVQNVLKIGEREGENSVKCESSQIERKKAEGLIESFGVLAQNLDRFSEIIKSNGFENVVI